MYDCPAVRTKPLQRRLKLSSLNCWDSNFFWVINFSFVFHLGPFFQILYCYYCYFPWLFTCILYTNDQGLVDLKIQSNVYSQRRKKLREYHTSDFMVSASNQADIQMGIQASMFSPCAPLLSAVLKKAPFWFFWTNFWMRSIHAHCW